ncbi:Cmx/CmrA family chloramphenicol efflux MFS transporter [Actinomadura fulvescens]|uniref:MFS transporter n=1 Tax=Actinomadura fulvescens TaxID=46160 RepID=A0ABP6D2Q5_9ACTN
MPFVLYLLALAVFAQGTSEFMLAGLVPDIAADLGVSIPAAGALTSAFAVGMVIGAPTMAVLSLRWPRRRALLVFLLTFLVVHAVAAVTSSFPVLVATRVIGALANAGFLAVALAAAAAIAGPSAKGRATSILIGGVTLACVAGVPAGALLGRMWGWRAAFWAVVLISIPAVIAIARSIPGTTSPAPVPPRARQELRTLRSPRLAATLLATALLNGATFCTFTYLASVVTEVAGFRAGWVPVMLALFGLGSFAGITLSGRLADTRPVPLLLIGGTLLLLGWAVFGLAAGNAAATVVLVLVQGTLSFAVGSTLITQVLYAASGAPALGGAFATTALNVGAAIGPWLGGLAIGAGSDYRLPLWVSACLVALALAVTASSALRRAAEPQ